EVARALSVDGVLDPDELVVTGRLPSDRRRWADAVFGALQTSGLIERRGAALKLSKQKMPSSEAVFFSLASQHPQRAAEILLAARMGAMLRDFAQGKTALTGAPDAAREAFEQRSPSPLAAAKALGARLETMPQSPNGPALRILLIGHGPATSEVLRFAKRRSARTTIFDFD